MTENLIDDIPLPGMPELDPASTPIGITPRSEPCWRLVNAAGESYLYGDTEPHFATKAEAEVSAKEVAEMRSDNDDDPDPLTPAQLSEPCWTAIAACGDDLADELDEGGHFPSAPYAIDQARQFDWSVIGGVLRCDDGDLCEAKA
jgi:hypothetical protein